MTRRLLSILCLLSFVLTAGVSLCLAQTGTITRVEQNDPSIVYSGDWYANSSYLESGGTTSLTNAKGAQASITFAGTGISWVGVSDPWAGVAWVYLDGTMNVVDTYALTTHYQQTLFSVRGLAPGLHTLSIYVPHVRDGSTSGSWVWIDAFDIENGSGLTGGVTAVNGRTEQNSPALNYTGTWFSYISAQDSGGSTVLAVDAGSRASISFNGTGIAWIAYRDEYSGIAKVYLDGLLQPLVDTYLSPAEAQSPAYAVDGLPFGPHSLTIEATGTHNSRSSGSWIWVDAFDVPGAGARSVIDNGLPLPSTTPPPPAPGSPSRMEQDNPAVVYDGTWFINGGTMTSGGTATLAMDLGSKATVTFTGSNIKWIGVRDEWSGIARVSVDGMFQENVDAYLTPGLGQQVIYQTGSLVPGTHTLTIEMTGTKNPASYGYWIWIDAFDIKP